MMRGFTLQRLLCMLLPLPVAMFTTIAVDAFSSPMRHRNPRRLSCSRHSLRRMDLFLNRDIKVVELTGDGSGGSKGFDNIKRRGIINRKVKKLNWLPTRSRRSYRNSIFFKKKNIKKNAKNKRITKKYSKKKKRIRDSIMFRWRGFRNRIRRIVYRNTVYVLECEGDKYYVGSTGNRKQRYRQHFDNERGGSKWTRMHKPIRVIAEYKRIPTRYLLGMESQTTAEYMMKYGINNVRGAAFCQTAQFTMADISDLTKFLGHYNQLDYKDLKRELRAVLPLPKSQASSSGPPISRPPIRMYRVRRNANTTDTNSNEEEGTKTSIPTKPRNTKRNRRKQRRALEKKKWENYIPSDSEMENQANNFNDQVDWKIEFRD